ncbi:hypothetical protein BS50DRAFT_637760 [Corynespora cassiicola Philippines]|uniref:Uncharacterized protein n=1 Tax=Corynespora cassiicola Philippines TaxID=1448308 RepID=A0A2T2NCR9_CORCC|nr:hypothetical protein BS50DRAFT_637760 [Corynespora cassiicola Philippines]
MCHWVLRVWTCGDSFFTKYSSCSYDRAAHDPANLLNPLHPSITPKGPAAATGPEAPRTGPRSSWGRNGRGDKRGFKDCSRGGAKSKLSRNKAGPHHGTGHETGLSQPVPLTVERASSGNFHARLQINGLTYPRDAKTGEVIPMALSEIGKASRFGDQMLGERSKCNVFEVVLQNRESTVCPACARSPKRARLPAHARGCFGLS